VEDKQRSECTQTELVSASAYFFADAKNAKVSN